MKAVLLALLLVVATACSGGSSAPPPPTNDPGVVGSAITPTTGPPPWPAPQVGVSALAERAGLPALPSVRMVEHIHVHLDVFYDGQPVVVPAEIGIDLVASQLSPLHTHDTSGIVHVETPTVQPFTLGQFFTEWNVQLGGGCAAGQCAPARPVALYVNGTPVSSAPADLVLHAHDEIALVIGTPPAGVPSSYQFPSGY